MKQLIILISILLIISPICFSKTVGNNKMKNRTIPQISVQLWSVKDEVKAIRPQLLNLIESTALDDNSLNSAIGC